MASKCAQIFAKAEGLPHNCWPIVYSDNYSVDKNNFRGSSHEFDTEKYRKIYRFLQEAGMLNSQQVVAPDELTREQLLEFHTAEYLNSLRHSRKIAEIAEVGELSMYPMHMIEPFMLSKLRTQAAGTILAARLALDYGWSINLGGGFHHCSSNQGGGFCFYADISAALKTLRHEGLINRALIVDLDAHQGNGHEIDFLSTSWVQTLDAFNTEIYPNDIPALEKTNLTQVRFRSYVGDENYFNQVPRALQQILDGPNKPDIIVYNAGTDCMANDPLGAMNISPQGIIKRDELVFRLASIKGIPITMVLSGGYQQTTARVIADSILNLKDVGHVHRRRSTSL